MQLSFEALGVVPVVFLPVNSICSLHLQATKAVKGTLNKLTPEKFERLLQQLVDVVTSAEILHTTISLVFESAVAQPTFVAMYADLCDRLSKVCFLDVCSISSMHVACMLTNGGLAKRTAGSTCKAIIGEGHSMFNCSCCIALPT